MKPADARGKRSYVSGTRNANRRSEDCFLSTKNLKLKTDYFFQLTMRRSDASACCASEYRGSISRASWKQRIAWLYISLPRYARPRL